jgi:hypothetical protein
VRTFFGCVEAIAQTCAWPTKLAVTQAPARQSSLNGGLDADARHYRACATTQLTPNGPRIASAVASLSPGDFTTVWASATASLFERAAA